jgi:hypothetical protein
MRKKINKRPLSKGLAELKTPYYPFPSIKELEEVRKELSAPNYSQINFVLGDNATPLEKSKYEICQNIARYRRENNLSEKEIGKKLGIKPTKKLECLFFSHINEFTLDELVEYASQLFAPFHLEIIPEKSLLFLPKSNGRVRKHL